MTLLYGLFVGIVMGVLLQRVQASRPGMIASMLRLENLTMMKFMALTIAVGAVAAYTLKLLIPAQMHFDIKPIYLLGVLGGGMIFGVGFGLGGYCPGTCVVGAGEGRKDALFTLLGGIVGALLFTLVYAWLQPILMKPLDFGKVTLFDLLHLPARVVAVAMAAVIIGIIALLPTVRSSAAHPQGGD